MIRTLQTTVLVDLPGPRSRAGEEIRWAFTRLVESTGAHRGIGRRGERVTLEISFRTAGPCRSDRAILGWRRVWRAARSTGLLSLDAEPGTVVSLIPCRPGETPSMSIRLLWEAP